MKAVRASIFAQNSVRFEGFDVPEQPQGDNILIKTERTVISAGTELSIYTGLESDSRVKGTWCEYPWVPGYGGVGRVLAIGPDVKGFAVGDRVYGFFAHASHQYYSESSQLLVRVPEKLDPTIAAMGRMFGVAVTAFQKSHVALRDVVVVIGLGQVGNMAGQFFAAAGAHVIGLDIAASRRALAEKVGFAQTLDPTGLSDGELGDRLMKMAGAKPRIVIDAVGVSQLIETAVSLVANNGEVVLLGSPRAPQEINVTPLLSAVHKKTIAMVGALEWCLPLFKRNSSGHSSESNTELIFKMLVDGGLKAAPLCSHVLAPGQLDEAYRGLLAQKETYVGVVLDWENNPVPQTS